MVEGYSKQRLNCTPDTKNDMSATGGASSFVLRAATALHELGTPSHEVESLIQRLARRLDVSVRVYTLMTALVATVGDGARRHVRVVRTRRGGEIQLDRLDRLQHLVRDVTAGRVTTREAHRQLSELRARPSPYGRAVQVLAHGAVAGSAGVLMKASAGDIITAALIGLTLGVLTSLSPPPKEGYRRAFQRGLTGPAQAFLSAFIATQLAALSAATGVGTSIVSAALAGTIVLVPGLSLTVAMHEIAVGQAMTGAGRLTLAASTFLQLAVGFAVGLHIATAFGHEGNMFHASVHPPSIAQLMLALLVAPLSLSVLFRAPRRDIGWVMIACLVAYASSMLGAHSLGPNAGGGAGAFVVGVFGTWVRRKTGRPRALAVVPGLILLVPGSIGLSSLSSFALGDLLTAVDAGFSMLLSAASLVTGLLLSSVVARPAARRRPIPS